MKNIAILQVYQPFQPNCSLLNLSAKHKKYWIYFRIRLVQKIFFFVRHCKRHLICLLQLPLEKFLHLLNSLLTPEEQSLNFPNKFCNLCAYSFSTVWLKQYCFETTTLKVRLAFSPLFFQVLEHYGMKLSTVLHQIKPKKISIKIFLYSYQEYDFFKSFASEFSFL